MMGTPSRTARAAAVRRGLKEAAGKIPARGTRSAYEARLYWARWRRTPNPKVIRRMGVYMRRANGRKVTRLTPGDLVFCPSGQGKSKGGPTGRQKSAGVIVGKGICRRAPRSEEDRCVTLDGRRRCREKAEMLERPFYAGGGTAGRVGNAHQTTSAWSENTGARRTWSCQ